MNKLEQAVQAIEQGLLTTNFIKDLPQERLSLRERMAYYNVPGFSIALTDQEDVAWTMGYGVLEAGGDKPVTEESIFQAASISKTVVAMTALALVEAGLLDLDVDVNEVLRSWQVPENEHTLAHKVTLRGLLSHTRTRVWFKFLKKGKIRVGRRLRWRRKMKIWSGWQQKSLVG